MIMISVYISLGHMIFSDHTFVRNDVWFPFTVQYFDEKVVGRFSPDHVSLWRSQLSRCGAAEQHFVPKIDGRF